MADSLTAISITIDPNHEGGFQCNPHDRANWTGGQVGVGDLVGTKYGITALDMPGADIANLTVGQAVQYYQEHYWKTLYSQIESQPLANKLFDMGVLFGIETAVEYLQSVLAPPVACDGVFGVETLDAVNQSDPAVLLSSYKTAMKRRAVGISNSNPNDGADLAGWLRRINS